MHLQHDAGMSQYLLLVPVGTSGAAVRLQGPCSQLMSSSSSLKFKATQQGDGIADLNIPYFGRKNKIRCVETVCHDGRRYEPRAEGIYCEWKPASIAYFGKRRGG